MTLLSGLGATATAIAAVIGLLSQFGLIGNRSKDKTNTTPVAAVATVDAPTKVIQQAASQQAPAVATPAPQIAEGSPHPHRKHRQKTLDAEQQIAGAPVPRTVTHAARESVEPRVAAASEPASSVAAAAALPPLSSPVVAISPAAGPSVAMVEPAKPFSLTGAWRDGGIGACHLINQSGNTFELTNFDPTTGEIMGHGMGTVDGKNVEITFPRGRVLIQLHISPDGTTMYGKITRPMGVSRAMWFYIGPQCSKAS